MKQIDNTHTNTNRLRNFLRSKRFWISLTLVSTVIIIGSIRKQIISAYQEDACQQINLMIAEKIKEGYELTPELEDDIISNLISASVINAQIDAEGNPSDYNGNAFKIVVEEGTVTTSTNRSLLHPFKSQVSWVVDPTKGQEL